MAKENTKTRLHAKAELDNDWPIGDKAPVHNHYYEIKQKNQFNFGKLAFGLTLILLGLIYLGINTGWLPTDLQPDLWKLWPLLIIFAGLSFIRGAGLASFLVGSILTITALSLSVLMIFSGSNVSQVSTQDNNLDQVYEQTTNTQIVTSINNFNIPLEAGQKPLTVAISNIPGQISLSGLASGAVEGELETNDIKLETNSSNQDDQQLVKLNGQKIDGGAKEVVNRLAVKLNNHTNSLKLDCPEASSSLDFSDLKLKQADINSGQQTLNLKLVAQTEVVRLNISQAAAIKLQLDEDASVKFIGQTDQLASLAKSEKVSDGVLIGKTPADYIIQLDQATPVNLE